MIKGAFLPSGEMKKTKKKGAIGRWAIQEKLTRFRGGGKGKDKWWRKKEVAATTCEKKEKETMPMGEKEKTLERGSHEKQATSC